MMERLGPRKNCRDNAGVKVERWTQMNASYHRRNVREIKRSCVKVQGQERTRIRRRRQSTGSSNEHWIRCLDRRESVVRLADLRYARHWCRRALCGFENQNVVCK